MPGVIYQQQYFLRADLEAQFDYYIPEKVIVYCYDLIGSNRVNNKAKIGPGFWNENPGVWTALPFMFESGGSGAKVPLNLTSGAMSGDYVCVLTVLQAWIDVIGGNIGVAQISINKVGHPFTPIFSAYPMSVGDTITIIGLETIADTSTLDIILI